MKWVVGIIAVLLVISGSALAQLPGDCDGNGIVNIDDATLLSDYFFNNGPEPVPANRPNCDCDNNSGINVADLCYLEHYIFVAMVPLWPALGLNTTETSRTYFYTVGVPTGVPGADKVNVYIAVDPDEPLVGYFVCFSFASAPGQAEISVASIDHTGSVVPSPTGGFSDHYDNDNKTFIVGMCPVADGYIPGGTIGLLCTVYFTQDSPGEPNDILHTSTARVTSQLYPSDFVAEDRGARVLYPGFVNKPLGDVNGSYSLDVDDVVNLVGYIFSGGTLVYW